MSTPSVSRVVGCAPHRARGLTLIELIMFIVIVGAAVAGIIGMIAMTTRSSADPMVRKQALSIAEAMLEEIRLQPFTVCDADETGGGSPPSGTVTVSGAATVATGGGVGNLTFPHTTPVGNNRLLVVGVSFDNDNNETVTGITYNGIALTQAGSRANSDDARVEIWYLVAPPVTTANVVVTLSASLATDRGIVAAALPLTGVDQTTPLGAFQSSTGDGNSPSLNVTSAASGDLVLAVYGGEQNSNSGTCSPGAGETEHWDSRGGNGATTALGCGLTQAATGGTVNISPTTTNNDHWAMGAVPVKPGGCVEAIGPETILGVTETRYNVPLFDHVNDYHGFDSSTASLTGIRNIDGNLIAGLDGYRVTVSVAAQPLGGIANDANGFPQSLLITVTVNGPGNTTVVLSGYRTRYAPNDLP